MRGGIKGFVLDWPHITSNHYMLHREVLMAKTLPFKLKEVMDLTVKMINAIKAKPKQSRIFEALCKEMDADFVSLLLYIPIFVGSPEEML